MKILILIAYIQANLNMLFSGILLLNMITHLKQLPFRANIKEWC